MYGNPPVRKLPYRTVPSLRRSPYLIFHGDILAVFPTPGRLARRVYGNTRRTNRPGGFPWIQSSVVASTGYTVVSPEQVFRPGATPPYPPCSVVVTPCAVESGRCTVTPPERIVPPRSCPATGDLSRNVRPGGYFPSRSSFLATPAVLFISSTAVV